MNNLSSRLNRVPQIVLLYWIIKMASTTLGETGADMFSMTYNLGYGTTILIFIGLFAIFLWLKLSIKRYETILYWLTFTSTAIAGTAISDFIDRTLGFGYLYGSLMLVSLLLIVLYAWYKKEKTINVEYITTAPAELYYWLAFLIANTLGTALGDYLADELGLGFGTSAIIIGSILTLIAIMHYKTTISSTLLFWLAFVLTRPFGATFGDLLTKTPEHGGIGIGTVGSSLFFMAILVYAIYHEKRITS